MKYWDDNMKRIVLLFLATATFLAMTACGNAKNTESKAVINTKEKTDVLVVYFSHTGKTKTMAEYLHAVVGGDIIELKPVKAYPVGYSDALDPVKKEQQEKTRPKIMNHIYDFAKYKTIYLGYPIWWGTEPMLINTFLEAYNFTGKTIIPFCTSGGSSIAQSISDIKKEVPQAKILNGLRISDKKDIIPWLKQLGMPFKEGA